MSTALITPGRAEGCVRIPGSKSISIRAVLAAALCRGETALENCCGGGDLEAALRAAAALGAEIPPLRDGRLAVRGKGAPARARAPVDCGGSATVLRLSLPLFAMAGGPVCLTGSERLLQRPNGVYRDLFRQRGLAFEQGRRELRFRGPLPAGTYDVPCGTSSQFASGLLLALPLAAGDSVLRLQPPVTSAPYIGLTRETAAAFGIRTEQADETTLLVPGGQAYASPGVFSAEGDWSCAAVFAALGVLCGQVACTGLSADSRQSDRRIVDLLTRMGAPAERAGGTFRWKKAPLRAINADLSGCPDLFPVMAVLCCFAGGISVLRGTGRLRYKESDRVTAMCGELKKFGFELEPCDDSVTVRGAGGRCAAPSVPPDGCGDHRVAMALALAACRADRPVAIGGAEAVRKSLPDFFERLAACGIGCTVTGD